MNWKKFMNEGDYQDSLLLSNEEAGKLVLDSIARRVYAAQHGKDAK